MRALVPCAARKRSKAGSVRSWPIHAEQNAIIQAGQDRCKDATIYIWGHNFICILCKRFIVQSGIKNCVLKKDENSPIVRVSVDDIRKELEEQK